MRFFMHLRVLCAFVVVTVLFSSACGLALPGEAKAEGDRAPSRAVRYGDTLPPDVVARLGPTRFRHGATVSSIRFSPGGRRVLSGSDDTTLLVWQPFLSEMKEARDWAKETRGLPDARRKAALQAVIRSLASDDYQVFCRARERILASGPHPGGLVHLSKV